MNWKRLAEESRVRYEQEVLRGDRGLQQRVFYIGLLAALLSFASTAIGKHGFVFNGWIDLFFWAMAALVLLCLLKSGWELGIAIWPRKLGYAPLTEELIDYARELDTHYAHEGIELRDAKITNDVDSVVARRLAEITKNNFDVNNRRNNATIRALYSLAVSLLFVAVLWLMSESTHDGRIEVEDPIKVEFMAKKGSNDQNSQQPATSTNTDGKPAEPQAIYITEGSRSNDQRSIQAGDNSRSINRSKAGD